MSHDKDPDFSGVTSGSSSTAPTPPGRMPASRTYTVVGGDNLSKIAKSFYGNDRKWRKIYDANRAVIGKNPDLIKPGQVLTIPDA